MKKALGIILVVLLGTVASSVPPTGSGSPSCYESDSLLVDPTVGTCPLESFCYSTFRRYSDGSVVHRRGCATTCMEEIRNRKIKRCCNTSLCNVHIEDPLTISATPTAPPTTPLPTQPSSPLITYHPPTLNPGSPNQSEPTNAPPTATPTNRPSITCYCDNCPGRTICTTDVACGSWYHYGDVPSGGGLTVMNVCLLSTDNCGPMTGTSYYLDCCFADYCNNVRVDSGAESTTKSEGMRTTEEVIHTHKTEHTSSSTVATTTQTTRGTHNIYFLVGIGIFVVAGVILIVIAIAVICYCVLSRRPTQSRKTRKATEASKTRLESASKNV